MKISCPVCTGNTFCKENIDEEKIIFSLESYFNTKIKEDLDLVNYSIHQCNHCSYSFSYPFKEGSNKFYTWITNQDTYYPFSRWEYGEVLNLIIENKSTNLLDVGCGDGVFLKYVQDNSDLKNLFGLDTTPTSIDNCHKKGLNNTFCETIDVFENSKNIRFDLVTTFHVLEHISNPIQFVEGLKKLINKNGIIVISTPYSPMNFEYFWFDILNKPPHHMGFWNEKSYRELANRLDMDITVMMPPNISILGTVLNSLKLTIYGPSFEGRINHLYLVLKNPIIFSKILISQIFRKKVNNKRASNVIMIILRNKKL